MKTELTNHEIAEAISEIMDNWLKLERGVRYLCPDATPEEVYEKTKALMDLAIQQIKERSAQ